MISKSYIKLNLLFIFTFPIFGLISFLKSGNIERYSLSLFFFFLFFGFFFVIPDSGDAYRHYQSFLEYPSMTWSKFWVELINILSFKSQTNSDIYVHMSNFILSRASTHSSFYYGFHALVYSLIYIATLKLILTNIKVHKTLLTTFFFLLVVLIAPISKIQYLRYYLATWLFLYGALNILKSGKNKFYLFFLLSVLVHFSFITPSLLFVVYKFFRKTLFIWLFLAVFSFVSNNFLSQYATSITNVSQAYLEDSQLSGKTKAYVENEEYIEQRAQRFESRKWYASPSKYLRWAFTTLLFSIGWLIWTKRIVIKEDLFVLFTFSLFLFSISQFGNAFASFGERFEQVFFIVFSVFGLHFFNKNSNLFVKNIAYTCLPLYLIFIVMSIRELFSVGDLFVFIGNPLVAIFVERSSFLSYLTN